MHNVFLAKKAEDNMVISDITSHVPLIVNSLASSSPVLLVRLRSRPARLALMTMVMSFLLWSDDLQLTQSPTVGAIGIPPLILVISRRMLLVLIVWT